MSRTRTLLTAVAVGSSTALIFSGAAGADPAVPPQPVPAGLPGLPAVEQLSPVIQQAASDPGGAASLLMAAAAAFLGDSATPAGSRQVADSVSQFVGSPAAVSTDVPAAAPGDPSAHVPTAGSAPGAVPHLPSGVNPARAAGPSGSIAKAVPPSAGSAPESVAHLPAGADPARAVGPASQAVPTGPEAATPAAPISPAPEAATPADPVSPTPSPASDATPEAAASVPDTADAAPGITSGFGPDSPPTQDFMYPSIGQGCLSDGGNSIATALSVAGPATIPAPGPGSGQTAYVFTAVGTPGPAEMQKLPLNVTWVNLATGKSGSATLKPRPDINPDGPTTLTAVVDTGSGSIMSTIFGQVTTKDHQCNFLPTIGSTVVP